MAETASATLSLKRLREEEEITAEEPLSKRSSYNQILSLLDEDEEEPTEDLSSLISSLQQEISSEPELATEPNNPASSSEDEEEKERVIRHLLEASDDELGIPNNEIGFVDDGGINGGGFELSLCDGLWEFEDETANYYTLLQSELFL